MFGIQPCVTNLTKKLEESYESITFHATGWGGQSMEALVAEGKISIVCDITTTEIADEIVGGVLSAGAQRLDVFSRIDVPYLGAAGALDVVNFGARQTLPKWVKNRKIYEHNSNVTLMRTNAEECQKIGTFIAKNSIEWPVHSHFFFLKVVCHILTVQGFPRQSQMRLFFLQLKLTEQSSNRQLFEYYA